MSLDSDIVDAIAEDLQTDTDLPTPKTLHLYLRPLALLPTQCPALVVWLEQELPILARGTTVRFEYEYTVGVSWHEATIQDAVTVRRSPETMRRLLDVKEIIRNRIHALASGALDPIRAPQAWSLMPGGSRYFQTPREEGLTEGFSFSVLVRTTQR